MTLDIGKAIRVFRAARNLTQDQLSELAGCDKSFVSLIEQNQRVPSLDMLCQLARALECPPWMLVFAASNGDDRAVASQPVFLKALLR